MEQKKTVFIERLEEIDKSFYNHFHKYPDDVFSSSGRIEIIGNHLDHNHGSVMVGTIDLSILAVVSPTQDNYIRYVTSSFPEIVIDITSLEFNELQCGTSIAIIKGILYQMKQLGYNIGGCNIYSSTNIFKGAGVSSSAAFENLIGQIMNYYYNDSKIKALERAKISQFAERKYFNKPCGLLDQAGIALGGINYIDFYDVQHPKTKRIEYEFKNYDFVIVNTKDSHSKLVANYSQIIDDMLLIANHYQKDYLIDVDENIFFNEKDELAKAYGERAVGRAVHFFEENKRVKSAFAALMNNDEDNVKQAIKVLNRAKGFFRSMIGKAMQLRAVPEITFYYDKTLDEGMRISTLITKTIKHDEELSGLASNENKESQENLELEANSNQAENSNA